MQSSPRTPRHVVITGCGSGLGQRLAVALDQRGWAVWAGVRQEKQIASLQAKLGPQSRAFPLDITRPEQVEAAKKNFSREIGELQALVLNGAIPLCGPVEGLSLEALERVMQVNVLGQIRVAQAFLPALRKSGGRILAVSAVGGKIAMPAVSPLCASKAALESFMEALRMELAPWRIPCILFRPGVMATEGSEKFYAAGQAMLDGLSVDQKTYYEGPFSRFLKNFHQVNNQGLAPEKAVRVMVRALESRHPRAVYSIGKERGLLLAAPFLPLFILDFIRRKALGLP